MTLGAMALGVPGLVVYGTVMVGVVPFAIVTLPAQFSLEVTSRDIVRVYQSVAEGVGASVMLVGGVAVATEFLPFSYLLPERRCYPEAPSEEPVVSDVGSSTEG